MVPSLYCSIFLHFIYILICFCRAAFTKLAYTKFHNAPLYLEWAPDDTFVKPFSEDNEELEKVDEESPSRVVDVLGKDEPEEAEDGSTLFVKNLNFDTTEESLESHFQTCGKIFSVTIATKKNTKTDQFLSMGYGFVTFLLKSSAEKALKTLQLSRLQGHCLELKRSNRANTNKDTQSSDKTDLGKTSTKILVRNIPFQAKKEEIAQLFRTFGELSAVRLPRKMAGTGDHRGFAFIEFSNLSDAKSAFSSLVHSTHLYGRRLVLVNQSPKIFTLLLKIFRLVLEWAQGEETLEELRDKTKKHWSDGAGSAANKKAR